MATINEELLYKIKAYIEKYYIETGNYPSLRKIANALGSTKSTIQRYLKMLSNSSLIYYTDNGEVRSEEMDKIDFETVTVPLVGDIACGTPIFAQCNITDYYRLPKSFLGSGEFYMLHAKGYSMIDAGINDGDKVIIRKQNTADEGQIIVALIDDEATLKRMYFDRKRKQFRLHPENNVFDDIYVKDLVIQGVAVKVVKDLI